MMEDRRVHAEAPGVQVVRYDRRGHWYVEFSENYGRVGIGAERVRVDVQSAVAEARALEQRGGKIHLGVPGGRTFDRLVAV
jgi:hypothetical protein